MNNEKVKGIKLGLDYELEIRDKDGKLISKLDRHGVSDPFSLNAVKMLKAVFATTAELTDTIALTSTLNVSKTFEGGGYPILGAKGDAGDIHQGPCVGEGEAAFNRNQTQLDDIIAHGSGSGQLLYSEVVVEAAAEENGTGRFRIIRTFQNSSGGSITVKEIGIYVFNSEAVASFMLCRDVLSSPQTVTDGSTLTLRYRMIFAFT